MHSTTRQTNRTTAIQKHVIRSGQVNLPCQGKEFISVKSGSGISRAREIADSLATISASDNRASMILLSRKDFSGRETPWL